MSKYRERLATMGLWCVPGPNPKRMEKDLHIETQIHARQQLHRRVTIASSSDALVVDGWRWTGRSRTLHHPHPPPTHLMAKTQLSPRQVSVQAPPGSMCWCVAWVMDGSDIPHRSPHF